MPELSERLNTPISTAELERRWKAVRAAMERERIEVLVMQNNNDHMGGYVKYFTDIPAGNGYPVTVVFPRDDLMTVVMQGPFGGAEELSAASDGVRRGYDIAQLSAVRERCQVPLVASGGAGAAEHFAEVFRVARVDAALAASVFHSGEIAIPTLRRELRAQVIEVRP